MILIESVCRYVLPGICLKSLLIFEVMTAREQELERQLAALQADMKRMQEEKNSTTGQYNAFPSQ